MKTINFSLGNNDIPAISRALSVLPAYDFFDSISPDLVCMPAKVIMKLNKHEQLDQREIHLIALAIDSAYKALRNEISVEDEAVAELRPYLFTINKLQPSFSVILESE